MKSGITYWALAAALLGLQGAVMLRSALQETQTYDEAIRLAAGYSHLKTGDYRINPEHPPLGKILAALPLLPLRPRVPRDDPSWMSRDPAEFGRAFLYKNQVPADTMLFRGRLVTMLLTLCLGAALAVWTRRHFGAAAGLLAVFLYALDPNVTAHGRYITDTVLVSLLSFLAVIAWGAWLRTGKKRDLLWAALALALGLVSGFAALSLAPIFAVLYLIRRWQQRQGFAWRRLAAAGLVLGAVGVAVIALAYAPETWRLTFGGRANSALQSSRTEGTTSPSAWLFRTAKRLGVPPYSYPMGLVSAAEHNHIGHPAYLLGQRSEKGGWWYYFPVAFAVKTPTAVLLLGLLGLLLAARRTLRPPLRLLYRRLREARFEWYLLTLPAAGYWLLWMRSNINIGLRHVLPVYAFLFVLIAVAVLEFWPPRMRRLLPVVLCCAISLQAYEWWRIYPHYLAFFNLPSGGPAHGPDYLADSNIDWGQDLKKLKVWHEAHGKPRLCLAYFGQADPAYYGLEAAEPWLPPTWDTERRARLDCIAAVSVTSLKDVYRPAGEFEWLRRMRPIDHVGYSIYIYDLRKPRPAGR